MGGGGKTGGDRDRGMEGDWPCVIFVAMGDSSRC